MRFICFAIGALLLLLSVDTSASSPPSGGQIRYLNHLGRKYVYLTDVAKYYGMRCRIGDKQALLNSKYSEILFTYEKTEGKLNGTKVYYLHPPFLRDGNAFISEHDFLKFIDPILRSHALPRHRMYTILLDPGHGGNDEGGKGRSYREKDIVRRLAHKVKFLLERKGYKVQLTREGDQFVSLSKRAEMSKELNADVFVSIHANIAGTASVSGIETFALPPSGVPSTHGSSRNDWEPGNKFDPNNSRLGYEIQKALINATGANDRGLKRARFYVIRKVECPAVLVEVGFLSNRAEELKLGKNEYQDKIAEAIADGIYNYHRAMVSKR